MNGNGEELGFEQLTLRSALPHEVEKLDRWERATNDSYVNYVAGFLVRYGAPDHEAITDWDGWYDQMVDHLKGKYGMKPKSTMSSMVMQHVFRAQREAYADET